MKFIRIVLGMLIFCIPVYAWAQAGEKIDIPYEETNSIVRYDILEMAKNMMSCATYYDVFEDGTLTKGFVDEVNWMFMVDSAQTEEETASWVASAYGLYHNYWDELKLEDSFEAVENIETQRRECYNLGVVRKIIK